MTFGAAAFLLAAFAAVIPPILHMINRQRAKQLPFSTLRFLKISVQKTRRRRQIRDFLLMLVRMAVLIFIAVGLARPTLTRLRSFLGSGQTAIAIILDNSASMGWTDEGRPRFEAALAAANQIINELQPGDQVVLWTTSGPKYPELGHWDQTHDQTRQLLAQIAQHGPSFESGRLGHLIQQARQELLETMAPNRFVFVITDNQTVAWEDLNPEHAEGNGENQQPGAATTNGAADPRLRQIPVVVIDCAQNPKPNVAIRRAELHTILPVAGVPMKVSVELFNPSPVPQQGVVELHVDGGKIGVSPEVALPPKGSANTELVFTLARSGIHHAEVRLVGADGAAFDNRRFLALDIDPTIFVAIVTAERHPIPYLNDSFYLEKALQPVANESWAIKTTTLTAADLATEPLSDHRVIFLVDLPQLDPSVAARLVSFVENGGRLVWICGQDLQADAYNAANEAVGGKLLPAPLGGIRAPAPDEKRDSWHIAWLDSQHPALAGLHEPPSLYQSVLVYKYVKVLDPEKTAARVLARLDGNSDPLLLERPLGQGAVLWFGTSVHVDWTNFPLRPIFVPLMTRLTFYLAGSTSQQREILAGQPIVVPFQGQIPPSTVEITPPDGALLRLQVDRGKASEFRYTETYQVGIYSVRLLASVRPMQKAFAVNADPDESTLDKIGREELEAAFSGAPVIFCDTPDDLGPTFAMLRHGRSLSELFLGLVLVGLVFETFISNWFSGKEEQDKPRVLSQYRPVRRLTGVG